MRKNLMMLYLISFIILVVGCFRKIHQVSGEIILGENYKGIVFEKEKLELLEIDFGDLKTWIPNENDIKKTEQILSTFIQKDSSLSMPLSKYIRQYFGIIENLEKVVYINSFCLDDDDSFIEGWKTDYIEVEDGGDCFFQIKVNLDQEICFDFFINGEA